MRATCHNIPEDGILYTVTMLIVILIEKLGGEIPDDNS
jgi:hypothetical protein